MPVYQRNGITLNTHFIGLGLMGKHATVENIVHALKVALSGIHSDHNSQQTTTVIEYMCHPGYAQRANQGGDSFSESLDREWEMTTLKSTHLKQLLTSTTPLPFSSDDVPKVRLISWGDVWLTTK
jgi:hypothetical protein